MPRFSVRLRPSELPEELVTDPISRPRFLRGNGDAVLLVHGFTGSPHDMVYLGERLNSRGWTVSIPRLPGHGSAGVDLLNSGRRDWLRRVIDAYLDLKSEYSRVYVCGLSMGGALALMLASHFPVERLALAAPALEVTKRLLWLSPIVGPLMPRFAQEPDHKNEDKPELQHLTREYWSYQWNRPAAELYRLMRCARRRLKHVTSPTLTLVSERDDLVPMSVTDRIRRSIGASDLRFEVLSESNHVLTNHSERDRVADLIIEWFAGRSP